MRLALFSLLALALSVTAALPGDAERSASSPSEKPSKRRVPPGFVTTNGNRFELNGKPFSFVGANSYWLPLLTTQDDVEKTFQGMKDRGVKVLRTWGFNAINATELPSALQSGLTYYQVWNGTEWTLNDGPQGLQRLDNVIKTAGKFGIKIILTFTNNWVGYGGSELYVNWIAGAGATHDVFFSNEQINKSYQRYVRIIVNRYKNSPNIFAWELMNEARCLGDLPGGPNCVPGTGLLSKWYKRQSDFVRSLDPFHMITTGGEGQFFWADPPIIWANGVASSDYNYNGQAGEDFEEDLKLTNIDFGVYHMYPQFWYAPLDFPGSNYSHKDWGLNWIQEHADAAKQIGKPLILEEFGLAGAINKTTIYPDWVQRALDTRHAIMPWQFGQLNLTENGGNKIFKYADALIDGASPNDNFAIYVNDTSVDGIFQRAARVQASRSG